MVDQVRNIYKGKVLELNVERVELPNGQITELEIAHHPGGAVIVAVDAHNRVCLLRQFRHATGGWITELPAGKLDNKEDPIECARRELAEEAGVTAATWQKLGDFFSSPGVLTEVIHVYLARHLAASDLVPETHEVFDASWMSFDDALQQATRGKLQDAKTIIGLVWAAQALLAAPTGGA